MKILLKNSEKLNFIKESDLTKAIPASMRGKPLNFGQGEGQVEIENVVFGFYVDKDNVYYISFEEGRLGWHDLNHLVLSIISTLNENFDLKIDAIAEGALANDMWV